MKIPALLLLLTASVFAQEDVPKKAPITRYAGLWTNSLFTDPPPPVTQGPDVNPLEDYALAGVAPITGGYRVTLLNRKKPDERINLPNDPNFKDFKVLSVQYAKGNPLDTTVRLSAGAKQGTVSFDPKLLILKTPAPAAPQPPQAQNGQPPLPVNNPQPQAQPNAEGQRPPRPRVVAPPTANGVANPSVQGAPQRPNNIPRPQRR